LVPNVQKCERVPPPLRWWLRAAVAQKRQPPRMPLNIGRRVAMVPAVAVLVGPRGNEKRGRAAGSCGQPSHIGRRASTRPANGLEKWVKFTVVRSGFCAFALLAGAGHQQIGVLEKDIPRRAAKSPGGVVLMILSSGENGLGEVQSKVAVFDSVGPYRWVALRVSRSEPVCSTRPTPAPCWPDALVSQSAASTQ